MYQQQSITTTCWLGPWCFCHGALQCEITNTGHTRTKPSSRPDCTEHVLLSPARGQELFPSTFIVYKCCSTLLFTRHARMAVCLASTNLAPSGRPHTTNSHHVLTRRASGTCTLAHSQGRHANPVRGACACAALVGSEATPVSAARRDVLEDAAVTVAPEDYALAPGQISTVNRTGGAHPKDDWTPVGPQRVCVGCEEYRGCFLDSACLPEEGLASTTLPRRQPTTSPDSESLL